MFRRNQQPYRTHLYSVRRPMGDVLRNCTCEVNDREMIITGTPVGNSPSKIVIPLNGIDYLWHEVHRYSLYEYSSQEMRFCSVELCATTNRSLVTFQDGVDDNFDFATHIEPGYKLMKAIMDRAGLKPVDDLPGIDGYKEWLEGRR